MVPESRNGHLCILQKCIDAERQRRAFKQIHKWAVPPRPIPHTLACSLTPMYLPLLLVWLQDVHFRYVLAAANLYAQMHGLPGSRDQPALREMLKLLPLPDPQRLASIFPSDLVSAELGEVPGPDRPCCHPSLTLPSACAIEGRGRGPEGPAANSLPLRSSAHASLSSSGPSVGPLPAAYPTVSLADFQQKSTNRWALGST